jgi:Na+/H+ antiporter NhaA
MVITGSLVSYVIVKYMIPMKRKEKKKPAVRLFNSATDNYTEYFYI